MLWEGGSRGSGARRLGMILAFLGLLILGFKLARRGLLPGFRGPATAAVPAPLSAVEAGPSIRGEPPVERAVTSLPPVAVLKVPKRRRAAPPVPSPAAH